MAAIFGDFRKFLPKMAKLQICIPSKYPVRDRAIFVEIALSRTVKEYRSKFAIFAIFGKNSKIQNGRHFRGGEFFFAKIAKNTMLKYLWVENFDEIALSRMVKEIVGNLCFAIFGKTSKIQNGRHFWGGENFLKIAKIAFLRYPVGRKFRRNRSISHG